MELVIAKRNAVDFGKPTSPSLISNRTVENTGIILIIRKNRIPVKISSTISG